MYKCSKCQKGFKYQPNLCRHQRFECNKVRSFSCPYCDYAAYQKSHLKTHVHRRHQEFFYTFEAMFGAKEPRKPLVKILKVEDLKSDKVVARIKKELAGTLSCGKPDTKPVQKSAERVRFKPNLQIKLEVPEGTQMVELQHAQSEPEDIEEEVIIDCDSTITQKDISALGSDSRVIIVQEATRGVFTRERREKFINMTISDLPKKEKFEKCLRPLGELSKPVDQIRCANCGIMFKSSLIAKHEFLCQGQRKKSKFGCMYCSFTHGYLPELEEHILKQHSKNKL